MNYYYVRKLYNNFQFPRIAIILISFLFFRTIMFIYLINFLKKGIPILTWSKTYSWEIAVADLVAGITIGLTLIPQCIAYASLAGLGPEVCSTILCKKSSLFGTNKFSMT